MNLANVTTSQLEYLVAALEEPTWRDAAEANGVSPSALSQGLGELERRLGLSLFDKQGRKRVPTAEAHTAARHAERVLAELRELTRWAQEVRSGDSGRIAIGMIDTAAIHHFGDTLRDFRLERPELSVLLQVQPSNLLIDQLRSGELDAVVCVDPDPDDRLVLEPLVSEPLHIYAPPDVEIAGPTSWGPWVSFPARSRTRALVARRMRDIGASFEVIAESSQPAVLREMVRLGMGWTVLPVHDAEQGDRRLERATEEAIAERTLTLARRTDRTPSQALALLLDRLQNG